MNILIANDDGIHAMGIIALAQRMSEDNNVIVIAPEVEKSGSSHAVTFADPIRIHEVDYSEYDGITAYAAADATPADCVLLGLRGFIDTPIDLVLTGINAGANLGTNISYSGTSNAALEGLVCGYPSIAVSQMIEPKTNPNGYLDYFETAADITADIIQQLNIDSLKEYALNINFPAVPRSEMKEIKVCRQGINPYDIVFEKEEDPWGMDIHWMRSKSNDNDFNIRNKTDVAMIDAGHISITPIIWQREFTPAMENIKCKIDDLKLHF